MYINTCFDVHLSYHEHLEELITEMLTLVLSPDAIRVTQEHFDSIKVQMNHGLRSQIKSAAYSQTKHTFSLLTQPVIYDWQPQIDALDEVKKSLDYHKISPVNILQL